MLLWMLLCTLLCLATRGGTPQHEKDGLEQRVRIRCVVQEHK